MQALALRPLLAIGMLAIMVACAKPAPTGPDVPADWVTYTSPARFTIQHPRTWEIGKEAARDVLFTLPDRAAFGIGVFQARCDFHEGCDKFLLCASRLIEEGLDPGIEHGGVSKTGWGQDGCCGCALESITTNAQQPTYFVQVFIPLAHRKMAVATYYRQGVAEITNAERELTDRVARTFGYPAAPLAKAQ